MLAANVDGVGSVQHSVMKGGRAGREKEKRAFQKGFPISDQQYRMLETIRKTYGIFAIMEFFIIPDYL